jgi:hypothetical protein
LTIPADGWAISSAVRNALASASGVGGAGIDLDGRVGELDDVLVAVPGAGSAEQS